MDYFSGQGFNMNGSGLQPPTSLDLHSGIRTSDPNSLPKTEAMALESCSILTSSMLMVNGIDLAVTSPAEMSMAESWPVTDGSSPTLEDPLQRTQPAPSLSSLTTPPPESSGFPPAYPYPWLPMQTYNFPSHSPQTVYSSPMSMAAACAPPGSLSTLSVAECYLRGSSLDDSPLSSPGSCNDGNSPSAYQAADQQLLDEHFGQSLCPTTTSMQVSGVNRSQSPLVSHVYGAMTQSVDLMTTVPSFEYAINHTPINDSLGPVREGNLGSGQKAVKMPQRKGGIQLWQFMYSLLTDPDKKYSNIIEWTANVKEREFRMLEPEAIAIWWGHHKNKPNMSYDKFSRSLRYYYDKGILKKIPGERYVYRFLIDPEHMYRHIGISECRPKLKPMPQAAKLAMTKSHVERGTSHSSPIITQAPEPLMNNSTDKGSPSPMDSSTANSSVDIKTCSSALFNKPPPQYTFTAGSQSNTHNALQVGGPMYSSASTGNLLAIGKGNEELSSPPIKRSRSLDCPSSRANTDTHYNLFGSSNPLPYGQYSPTYGDDYSPLPQISAESNFLDNPMLLAAQGGLDPIISEFNFVTCNNIMSTQPAAVTPATAGLFTQPPTTSLDCKPFSMQNHTFNTQWN